MNPDREKLLLAVKATGSWWDGFELTARQAGMVVDAVLAVLQQDKTTEDQVVSAEGSQAVDPVSVAAADLVREGCREELGAGANWHRCNRPAEFVLWGKLIPPEGLGPRCYDHAAKHVGYHAVHPNSGYALMDLRPVQRALAAGSMAEPSEPTPAEVSVPRPSQGWIGCRDCQPRQACPAHREEAEAYYGAVRAQYLADEKARLAGG